MAIFGLNSEWFENLTLETRPKRHYSSASAGSILETGTTGSVYVFAERSKFEKEAQPLKAFTDLPSDFFGGESPERFRRAMIASASLHDPVQVQQVTELTFATEDESFSLTGGYGTSGKFDYRNLLGHSSHKYISNAFLDLTEPAGSVRRFYFYNSSWGNSKSKPAIPGNGSLHMIDLSDLSGLGDPSLPIDAYNPLAAIELVASATNNAINSVGAFESVYTSDYSSSTVTVTNIQYGGCLPPVSGVILNPITGNPVLDLDLDADGIGDQVLPTFPYNIFNINVETSGSSTSINTMLGQYMGMVNDSDVSSRKQTAVAITRFEPSFKLTSDTLRKNVIKDVLFPHYRTKHPSLHWAFTNYNTINFFTSSMVPPDSAFIYPSITDETTSPSTIPYSPSGSFTFEFYINPRYSIDEEDSYASGSFVVNDWEQLFIDFHGGGRGAHTSDWVGDWLYEIDLDADADPEWVIASVAGYTGTYDGTDLVNQPDIDPLHPDAVTWTENEWYIIRNAADPSFTRHENLITDKGDEAPDYDFRSGDPIVKNCNIVCNDGINPTQTFEFVAPGNIHNATDWTVGKNDVGDFDNYTTSVNIATTIDGNEYFKSWAEKIEVVDEIGQQKVDEAEKLLWTDDNGLNEYNIFAAVAKDFPSDPGTTINSYQAVSAGSLLWGPPPGITARSIGHALVVSWSTDAGVTFDSAIAHGYTGYYNNESGVNVPGPIDVNGNQYWYDTTIDITDYRIATDWTDPDTGLPYTTDNEILDDIEAETSNLSQYPGHINAAEWTIQSWADYNKYDAGYEDIDPVASPTLSIPDEAGWMEHASRAYSALTVSYAVDATLPTAVEQANWANAQGYKAVTTYEPTYTYGKVWVQTLIPGWDGNVGTISIETTQQLEFIWYAWEEVEVEIDPPVDIDPADGINDTEMVWQWVEYTESSTEVDEDARLAFADPEINEFVWDQLGTPIIYSTIEAELDLKGGRDHVVVDRDQSHAFNAGTILHMSSSYAVSLVTGSNIDLAGHPDAYRIMLQLSSSADIPPSHIPYLDNGTYGNDKYYDYPSETWIDTSTLPLVEHPAAVSGSNLVFISSDNSLDRNSWHHVAIRWGTDLIDDSKAQIIIDGVIDTEFNLPIDPLDNKSVSDLGIPQEFGDVEPRKWTGLSFSDGMGGWTPIVDFEDTDIEADPAALFIGNYFEGKNGSSYSQTTSYLDAEGLPTIEGDHVATSHAWYVQEADPGSGKGRWKNSAGIEILSSDIPVALGDPAITDSSLRELYFIAQNNYSVNDLEYMPILSSTLAPAVTDLEAEYGKDYVYEQVLTLDSAATQYIQGFFSYEAAEQHGITWGRLDDVDSESGWSASDPDPLEPNDYSLRHPLNAEVHEIKIWNEYRTLPQIWATQKDGIEELEEHLLFYLPPFFTKESREREVMLTPFQTMKSTTDDPFNVAMSFGIGAHMVNLENFSREFVRGEYPLLMNLTGSTIDVTTSEEKEANEFLNASPAIRKRNLTILPCDNGIFIPDFTILASGSYESKPGIDHETSKYVNDYGTIDYGLVTLRDMVPEDMMQPGLIAFDSSGNDDTSPDSIFATVAGSTPENPGVAPGSVLAILQRTRDTSSNEVVFFDVSNLFYGKKINPSSFKLTDHDVTGSGGKVSITLRDNGHGLLYRADANTDHAKWSSVGNIIYEEGIAIIHNPCIPYFGKEQFEVDLEGNHNIHIMEMLIPCGQGQINSSSNPRYKPLKASTFASEEDSDFVYITGLNFHDENLNIIARTSLAQPITKRDADNLTFRVKVDF